jgi:hypothetical protein
MKAVFPRSHYKADASGYTPYDDLLPVLNEKHRNLIRQIAYRILGQGKKYRVLEKTVNYALAPREESEEDNKELLPLITLWPFLPAGLRFAFARAVKAKNPKKSDYLLTVCMPFLSDSPVSGMKLVDGYVDEVEAAWYDGGATEQVVTNGADNIQEFESQFSRLLAEGALFLHNIGKSSFDRELHTHIPFGFLSELLIEYPNPVLSSFIYPHRDEVGEDWKESGRHLAEEFSRERFSSDHTMRSPLCIQDAAELTVSLFYGVNTGQSDLALALAEFASCFQADLTSDVPSCWVHETSSGGRYQNADHRLTVFMRAYRAAEVEGFLDLSGALLAFLIFTQAIAFEGRVGDLRELSPAIRKSLGGPAGAMVRRACEIAYEAAQLNEQCGIERLFFGSISAGNVGRSPLQILPLSFPRKRSEANSWFEAQIGEEAWAQLDDRTQELFVDAELKWASCHREAGADIVNWNGLGLEFVTPIEFELETRLKEFYQSRDFQDYLASKGQRVPKQPTLGNLIFYIFRYRDYPEPLKRLIVDCAGALPYNKNVKRHLEKLVEYRNDAAHARAFDAKRFVTFRQFLFQDGFLRQFITSLTKED